MTTYYDRFFVFIVPAMILGFLSGELFLFHQYVSWIFFILFIITFGLSKRLKFLQQGGLVLMIGLSSSLGLLNHALGTKESINIDQNSITGVARVVEISNSADWKQAILELDYYLVEDSINDCDAPVLAILQSNNLEVNDWILFTAELSPIRNRKNPGDFNEELFWHRRQIHHRIFIPEGSYRYLYSSDNGLVGNFLKDCRQWVSDQLNANLSAQNAALAHALLLGDKHLMKKEEKQVFSNAGAMHVLAVSGLHVGIIVYLLLTILSTLKRFLKRNTIHLIAVVFIWVYAAIIDFPPSVNRAAFMFTVLILGNILQRKADALNLLFFSAFVLILIDPYVIYDIGFQLSYLAMLGIFLFYRRLQRWMFIPNKWLRKIWETTVLGISAQITTLPLTLYYFHQFPNYFILSNFIVLLLAAVILGLAFSFVVFSKVPYIRTFLAYLFGVSLTVLFAGMSFIDDLPGSVAKGFLLSEEHVVVLYFLLFTVLLIRGSKVTKYLTFGAFFIAIGWLQFSRFAHWRQDHLVVFNSNRPIVAIHKNNEILVLYECKTKQDEDRALKIVEDYERIYPGRIQISVIEENVNRILWGDVRVVAEVHHFQTTIYYNDEVISLRKSMKAKNDQKGVLLAMPYLAKRTNEYSLDDGAYQLIF